MALLLLVYRSILRGARRIAARRLQQPRRGATRVAA
jgi:hypothetical protein